MHACVYFAVGQHGGRREANRRGESAAPAGAVLLLGHAGVGLIHCRYESPEHCASPAPASSQLCYHFQRFKDFFLRVTCHVPWQWNVGVAEPHRRDCV